MSTSEKDRRPLIGGVSVEHVRVMLSTGAPKCERCGASGPPLLKPNASVALDEFIAAVREFAVTHSPCRGGRGGVDVPEGERGIV